MITSNPADRVKLPQMKQKEIEFLSVGEQKALLSMLPDNTAGRAIRFTLGTGLRASELCGFCWWDIESDQFIIRQGAQYVRKVGVNEELDAKHSLQIEPPKSAAGRRTIPLTASMQALLDAQRQAQIAERLKVGTAWIGGTPGQGECYVFATEVGTVFDRCNLARVLRASLDKALIKRRGIHALRHTFATNCIRAGMDLRTLSEILGHSDVALTLRLYVHSDMDAKRAGMLAVEKLI